MELGRVLRRGVEGALFGASLTLLDWLTSPWTRGYPIQTPVLAPAVAMAAAWTLLFWAVGEIVAGRILAWFRRPTTTLGFAVATLAVAFVWLRYGHSSPPISWVRAVAEVAVGLAILLAAWRAASNAVGRAAAGTGVAAATAAAIVWASLPLAEVPVRPVTNLDSRPNVVVVMIDTLRTDRTSLYGAERQTTPHLEALAREGTVFTRAYAPSAWTAPSVASIFTGAKVHEHGATGWNGLSDDASTVAEWFRSHGWATFGSTGNGLVSARFGYDQGFDDFRSPEVAGFESTWIGRPITDLLVRAGDGKFVDLHRRLEWRTLREDVPYGQRPAAEIAADFERWLDGRPGPFFAYLHFMEPHDPYRAPEPHRGTIAESTTDWSKPPAPRPETPPTLDPLDASSAKVQGLLDAYDEEILAVDAAVGRIVEILRGGDVLDRTVLAVVSDHGEEFGDHGGWRHGSGHTFDELVRALFLVRFPRASAPIELPAPVSLRVLPGLLTQAAGIPPLPGADPWNGDLEGTDREPVLVELLPAGPPQKVAPYSFSAIDGPWKLVRHRYEGEGRWREWLFDVERDPGEREDLRDRHPEVAARLGEWLDEQTGHAAVSRSATRDRQSAPELRALGYVQ